MKFMGLLYMSDSRKKKQQQKKTNLIIQLDSDLKAHFRNFVVLKT